MSPTSRGAGRLVLGHQLLVRLLAGAWRDRPRGDRGADRGRSPAAHDLDRAATRSASRAAGILKTKTSPPWAISAAPDRQLDRAVGGHHEPGHRRVRDGHRPAGRDLAEEQLQRGPARAEDVAEADAREGRRCVPR